MALSQHDVEHIHDIMGGDGTWFSALLLRLIPKADPPNRELLRQVFPAHVELVEWWWAHGAHEPAPLHLIGATDG